MEYVPVSSTAFAELEGVDDWRYLLGMIVAEFAMPTYPAGAALIGAVAEAAEAAEHHPDVRLSYPGVVRVQMTTHAVGGLTQLDVELARTISRLAAEVGAEPRPTAVWELEIGLDAVDPERIKPFWRAVLGYVDDGPNLVDPRRRGPALWFQAMDPPRTERNRFHLDISVPHDVAEERLAAALAAGGTLVSDRRAKAFWVLADAEGNEICICTWQDR